MPKKRQKFMMSGRHFTGSIYGRGRDPRCANFMAHGGYEPTAMLATMGSLKQSLRALAGVQGPGAHDQEGADGMGMPDVTGPAAVVVWQARQQLA